MAILVFRAKLIQFREEWPFNTSKIIPVRTKYIILGAGPSGLSFAHTLLAHGEESFVILEKENEPGGLCRSTEVDGAPLDIGGGHFLDVRNKEACEFLFRFMPRDEWNLHTRVAKIKLRGCKVDHPLEANLWQLPMEAQVDYLESIAQAGCVRNDSMPEFFEDWCRWKFGERIAEEYMLPYNRKLWRIPINEIGTYWLHKLPNVSFRETLLSCLQKKMYGTLPAHGEFLYPKLHGYGEVWKRMGKALGGKLILGTPLTHIDFETNTVNGTYRAETIVTSIPWPAIVHAGSIPADIQAAIAGLVNIPIDVDYHSENIDGTSHWIYEPDETVSHHRILARSNFTTGSRGHWTETNARVSSDTSGFRHRNEYAYPVNSVGKPSAVTMIHRWANSVGLIPIGRWGNWEHINSDIAVTMGMQAGLHLMGKP